VVLLAGALTAVVAAGAGLLVVAVRDGGTPAALDRAVPSVTAPATRAPARPPQPAPVAAGTLRAAASSPAASPTSPPASTPASRERRSAPVPTTRAAAGATRTGTATFYTLAGLPNCGYPDAAASGTYVALSPADFAGSAACGTVFDVTGPKGTVQVTVADQCPECEAGHLDLAAPAFARIADPVAGIVPNVDEFSNRPATKNHTRSFDIGPPPVNSWKRESLLLRYGFAVVGLPRSMLLARSNGVSLVQDGRVKFPR